MAAFLAVASTLSFSKGARRGSFDGLVMPQLACLQKCQVARLEVEFPDYRVVATATGEEAVGLLSIELPCLVVMDISLPGISGIEATRQIKAKLPSVQVVMLTIHESDVYRLDAASAGASAYLSKRAMPNGLVPTLAALLADKSD